MFGFKSFYRSMKLWSWSPDPAIRRRHEPLPDGSTRVVLTYGHLRASVDIGPGETEWPFVFDVLDAMCAGLINGEYEAILREQARLRRVPGTTGGVPRDVKLRDLDDKGKLFAEEIRMIARRRGIVERPESEKAAPTAAKHDLEWPECSGK